MWCLQSDVVTDSRFQDAISAKLPAVLAAFTTDLADVQDATRVSMQRTEETRAEINGLEEHAAKIQVTIDQLAAQAAVIKVWQLDIIFGGFLSQFSAPPHPMHAM